MDGRQLADEARRRDLAPRVLFTTGHARDMEPGIDLVTKPFTYAGLAMKIREVLEHPPSG
jgi:hypothetical protein